MLLNFDLPTHVGILAALFLAVSYVTSLYIWPQKYHRNHPTAVKQRSLSALVVTLLAPLYLIYWGEYSTVPDHSLLNWIGFRKPLSAIPPLLLTVTLFSGPLFQSYMSGESLFSDFSDLILFRNLVVAPITEEIVFRGCLAPLVTPSVGWGITILTLPLFFGVAHLHHAYEMYKQGAALSHVILQPLLQTAFTSAFGAFSTWVFLTTGSIFGPITCHMFCNIMGLPDFGNIRHSKYPGVVWAVYVAGFSSFLYFSPSVLNCANFNSLYCRLP